MGVADVLSRGFPFDDYLSVIALIVGGLLVSYGLRAMKEPAQVSHQQHCADEETRRRRDNWFGVPPVHPREEGTMTPSMGPVFSNADETSPFDNEFASGTFLSMHRPTYDKALDKSGDYKFSEHFAGKKRLWEARVQFCFKKPPDSTELLFGIELEQYVPLNAPTKSVMEIVVSMLKATVGDSIHHSPGDDPQTTSGELERPMFMMPLWAFDQFIVTPEGQEPPKLNDPNLPNLGKKRSGRVDEYRRELDELQFRVGPTYTFSFWGISRFLDKLRWEVRGIPIVTPLDFDKFCGRPPVHVVLYTLKKNQGKDAEKRHLDSRKNYYFNVAFWSSNRRPDPKQIEDLMKTGGDISELRNGDILIEGRRRLSSPRYSNIAWDSCCASR